MVTKEVKHQSSFKYW